MTPKEFFDKVVEMRRCQKEYFKNKRQIDLRISKQIEREVDEEIERVQKILHDKQKALKTLKIPMNIRQTMLEYGVYGKIPIEYRKYNPVEIAQLMIHYNMNPQNIKEYHKCMKRILNK